MTERPPQRYTFDRVVRMVLTGVVLIAVLALLRYLSDVLLPFAAAVVLAYLLNPVVSAFEQRTNRRGLSVGVTIGGLTIVGLGLVLVLVPLTFSQISRFQTDLGKLRQDLATSVASTVTPASSTEVEASNESPGEKTSLGWRELQTAWSTFRRDTDKSRSERLSQFRVDLSGTYAGAIVDRAVEYTKSEEFDKLLIDAAKRVAVGGWTVVTFAINLILGLTGLIVVMLYLVFLLLDYPDYARTWQTFLPPDYRKPIVEFLGQFDVGLRRYLRGQSVVALIVGTLFAIGFTLIGLPMALPFGLFVGILNMVPYLQTVAVVPAVLLASLRAIEGDASFAGSIALTLMLFVIIQVVQDALITPRVMGQATGLRPVAILLGVFIWGKLLGFLGLILAIPLTCLGIAYYRRFVLLHGPAATAINAEPKSHVPAH